MICPNCGKDISSTVYPFHILRCKPKTKETVEEYKQKYTVKELKTMCKEKNLKGYSKLKEAELIKLLQGSD